MTALLKAAGLLAASTTLASAAWVAGDYTEIRPVLLKEFHQLAEESAQINKAVLLIRFQLLMERAKFQPLDFDDQQELCRIAKELQFSGVPGC